MPAKTQPIPPPISSPPSADARFPRSFFPPVQEGLVNRAIVSILTSALWLTYAPEALAQSDRCNVAPSSQLVVDVKKRGAKGDGHTDDTAAIQKAIDAVAGKGGTAFVPDGVYLVDALTTKGLKLKSRMRLKLAPGATLKAIPNSGEHYAVLTISGASGVTVEGGTLLGERRLHKGQTGEWGMGIGIQKGAERITIAGVTSKEMWGDGFYVDGAKDVAFCGVVADHNRRQGLSIIDADTLLVTHSVFKNTRGTRPSAGVDFEPDEKKQRITNVRIVHSKFVNNAGGGILISAKKGIHNVENVEITGNFFNDKPPIKIKYAPGVRDTDICRNRYVVRREPTNTPGVDAGPPREMTITARCGDPGLRVRY